MTTKLHFIILFLYLLYSANSTNGLDESNSNTWGLIDLETNIDKDGTLLR
jgi:hypothetical protein